MIDLLIDAILLGLCFSAVIIVLVLGELLRIWISEQLEVRRARRNLRRWSERRQIGGGP